MTTPTKSGLPVYTGTGTPELFLSADIYAHALGLAIRGHMPAGTDEAIVAREFNRRLYIAAADLVRDAGVQTPGADTNAGVTAATAGDQTDASGAQAI